jgi:hypothetical protein
LWVELTRSYEYGPRELQVLAAAARQADDIAQMEALLAHEGLVVPGSRGQLRLSPVLGELRLARLALERLLGALSLPEADEVPRSAASVRAQKAARARWSRTAALRERRTG